MNLLLWQTNQIEMKGGYHATFWNLNAKKYFDCKNWVLYFEYFGGVFTSYLPMPLSDKSWSVYFVCRSIPAYVTLPTQRNTTTVRTAAA